MPGCAAFNCTNNSRKGYRLFCFPSDKERRAKWAINCRNGRSWVPPKFARLCELHFEVSEFEQRRLDGNRKLRPFAVPTKFDVPNPHLSVGVKPPIKKRTLDEIGLPVIEPEVQLEEGESFEEGYFEESRKKSLQPFTVLTKGDVPNPPVSVEIKCKLPQKRKLDEINKQEVHDTLSSFEEGRFEEPGKRALEPCANPPLLVEIKCKPLKKSKPDEIIEQEVQEERVTFEVRDHRYFKRKEVETSEDVEVPRDHRYSKQKEVETSEDVEVPVEQDELVAEEEPVTLVALEEKYKLLQQKFRNLQKEVRRLKTEQSNLTNNVKKFLGDDQIEMLKSNNCNNRGKTWSNLTLLRSLQTRFVVGEAGYDFLRRQGYPLPSRSTLYDNKIIHGLKSMDPDIQVDVLEYMKEKFDYEIKGKE